MTEEQRKSYGFNNGRTKVLNLFLMIPIYPKIILRSDIQKQLNLTCRQLSSMINSMPVNAPMIEDYEYLSRWN